ncbi:hypothetical protein ACRE_030520 [Hapsidospora chrysogenum ATCC 11550]|uniref:Uncharacterized protein n=1 Tax=Hapsidospora chrysogenum (strain ATCC 11550 / CBS 779.69 / DSM 880 / IAM 14645 / JCM 23072 / IMI 49137) TaxID=857340 RepID=A0A086T9T2_HAPC1|nr:hypothetical protein ACRE_030520 [Hapsidospora chrysogenum ATCC 11550]
MPPTEPQKTEREPVLTVTQALALQRGRVPLPNARGHRPWLKMTPEEREFAIEEALAEYRPILFAPIQPKLE